MRISPLAALAALLLLAACSTEQATATAQAWQRNECNRLPDRAEQQRCLERADASRASPAR